MIVCTSILESIGYSHIDTDRIEIYGTDPILPTPFFIGEAGASALAAVGYVSSELWALKTNSRQRIEISVKDAALAQRSHHYLTSLTPGDFVFWDTISGFYQTQDNRFIQFHCNFPHHKQGVLDLLGCKDDKEDVARAAKTFQALYMEETLQSSGMCARIVRSGEEWKNHPQYQAIKDLPIIEIIKLGDSSAQKLPEGERPLSGIQVLDLTRIIAGPVCGKTLAEHGADVLLITSPHLPFIRPLVIDTGHGKKAAHLDLNALEDKEKLKKLVKNADIFCQSYRPYGLCEKGFSPEDVSQINPSIIYVTFDAYTHLGPWSMDHGFDSLVQSATGIALEQGDGFPEHLPAQSLDYLTGYFGALGTMEALRRRAIHGGSYHVRVSLVKTAKWLWDLGRVTSDFKECTIPSREEIPNLFMDIESDFSSLKALRPVLKMSETPPYYTSPPVFLGSTKL